MDTLRIAPISTLLLGLFLSAMGNGLQGTLVPLRASLEGFTQFSIGGIMSAYFVGYTLGALLAPRLILGVGHIRIFAAFASLASVVTLLHLVVIHPWLWIVFRALNGVCICVLSVVIESWLNSHALPQHRGKILSLAGLTTVIAIALGQVLLNFAVLDGFILFCLVSIVISLSLVPLSITRTGVPCIAPAQGVRMRHLITTVPFGLAGMFLTGMSISALLSMGPSYAQSSGLTIKDISAFMAMLMIGAVFCQWPLGWLSDKTDRRVLIAMVAMGNLLASVVFTLITLPKLAILLPLGFLLGGLGQSMYPLFAARINDALPLEQVLTTSSSVLLIFGIGSIIGPFVASIFMENIGQSGLFWFLGILYTSMLLITLWDLLKNPTQTQSHQQQGNLFTMFRHHSLDNVDQQPEETPTEQKASRCSK